MKYKHLSYSDRQEMEKLYLQGWHMNDIAAKLGVGRTPQLCQDALIEMLKELFAGKLFCGQEGRKALKIYKQDLPIPQSDDADVDTDKAEAPYIVVRMTGGQIEDDDSPQTVDFTVTPEINAFIEAAVKELDLAEKNAIGEIGKIFSDAEQTPQN